MENIFEYLFVLFSYLFLFLIIIKIIKSRKKSKRRKKYKKNTYKKTSSFKINEIKDSSPSKKYEFSEYLKRWELQKNKDKEKWLKSYNNTYQKDMNIVYKMGKQIQRKKNYLNQLNYFDYKGSQGELNIFHELKFLEKEPLFLFNIYFPINKNKFTEIDMIMLHPSGLYIFESKNIKGWIFGKEDDTYWTQCLLNNRGKTDKFKFLNPIKQNKQHIKIFKKYAKYRPIPVYNCVVFGENSTFKNIQIDSSDIIICSIENILNNIEENKHFSENNLTTEQICKIYNKSYPLTLRTEEFKKRHIDRIKKETY